MSLWTLIYNVKCKKSEYKKQSKYIKLAKI